MRKFITTIALLAVVDTSVAIAQTAVREVTSQPFFVAQRKFRIFVIMPKKLWPRMRA
jgi:hypothetical protein